MKNKKKADVDRLLTLLGAEGCVQPSSFKEAAEMAEHSGATIERRSGIRKDNDCMKVCFTSETQAKSAANRRVNTASNVSRLRTYFCETCKAYHLTSSFRG